MAVAEVLSPAEVLLAAESELARMEALAAHTGQAVPPTLRAKLDRAGTQAQILKDLAAAQQQQQVLVAAAASLATTAAAAAAATATAAALPTPLLAAREGFDQPFLHRHHALPRREARKQQSSGHADLINRDVTADQPLQSAGREVASRRRMETGENNKKNPRASSPSTR